MSNKIRPLAHDAPATALAFSPNGKLLWVVERNSLQVHDLSNDATLTALSAAPSTI
jgi:sugar lactone lactonase YvrE